MHSLLRSIVKICMHNLLLTFAFVHISLMRSDKTDILSVGQRIISKLTSKKSNNLKNLPTPQKIIIKYLIKLTTLDSNELLLTSYVIWQ